MNAKEFLAKIVLGRDVYKDLTIAEKEMNEAKDKYSNACQTLSVLEDKYGEISKSLDTSSKEKASLQSEKESIDALLLQLLNNEELCDAKTILECKRDDKKALLGNIIEELSSSQKEHDLILAQLGKLKEEKTSLDHDVDNLNHEIESLKEKSKQREEQKAKISQRKEVRDNLSTLKDKWQGTLDDFKTRIDDADNLKSLEGLKRELVDYERLVNNAIEISVK
jgi:uncharacterized coiled-coil DUF342 family protein